MKLSHGKGCAFRGRQATGLRTTVHRPFLAIPSHAQKPDVRTNAAFERLLGFFNGFGIQATSSTRNKLRATSSELLKLLCSPDPPALSRVDELVDELISAEGQPFREASLGGGPWVVRYTRGKPLLWNLTYNSARLINSRNRAAQDFDPATRAAVNLVEINGPDNRIEAYGTYEPVDESDVTPKAIRVNITSGRLILGSWELPLPVAGTGMFEVIYADDAVRVFSSNRRFAVQVRADKLGSSQEA